MPNIDRMFGITGNVSTMPQYVVNGRVSVGSEGQVLGHGDNIDRSRKGGVGSDDQRSISIGPANDGFSISPGGSSLRSSGPPKEIVTPPAVLVMV